MNGDNGIYCDSSGVEYIPKKIRKIVGNKNMTTNIYRTQANDSIMCGYFRILFNDFMLEGKRSLDYINFIFPK